MEAFRQWWAAAIANVADFLGDTLGRLYQGILYDWNTRYFVLGTGLLLIIAMTFLWRRKF